MLQADPRLAELPGCSTEQLVSLARSIEHKTHQLEADIDAYIRAKQQELDMFQKELVEHLREQECAEPKHPANSAAGHAPSNAHPRPSDVSVDSPSCSSTRPPDHSPKSNREERAKRTKVHKREKELFGLVTPIFLPLLDASDTTKDRENEKEKRKRLKRREESSTASPPAQTETPATGDAEQVRQKHASSDKRNEEMEMEMDGHPPPDELQKENKTPESSKKGKRPAIKKSSLRNSGEKRRRKRVSLVIDGQTVRPADLVPEPPLMSPSEATVSSGYNSTASLEDMLDPRLRGSDGSPVFAPHDTMHHSINLPTHLPSASPTKHTGHTLPESPFRSPTYQSPPSSHAHLEFEPPQSTVATSLTPSSPHDATPIPRYASAAPIYAAESIFATEPEQEFRTYVGGMSGSGVDDVDQTGSLGYPSSLGASYMESYMQSRPLSVRMAAAEKAVLSGNGSRTLMDGNGGAREGTQMEEEDDARVGIKEVHASKEDDDMDIMGSMEGF